MKQKLINAIPCTNASISYLQSIKFCTGDLVFYGSNLLWKFSDFTHHKIFRE